ncbi:hypothetical protein [Proteiniborus sp. MB09-C3]|uniref:hypothetical protein n=1 Tax=Proteiniborus sp. MB09-C3 TaxID=3050072 RepID=UPI002555FC12|nr:hypothetical protein [Proteiniborus sp. MB09-C3]WIV13302.1 hypothetical protein QO263_06215 [Proteiniborus sp. MB09-C3]
MNVEVKKITKIVSEMVTFAMLGDAEKVDVSIENNNDMFKLLINARNVNRTNESVNNLRELLNAPRQRAAEEYYWELAGDNDMTTEIALVGMMTDHAKVIYEDNNLLIELHRYK